LPKLSDEFQTRVSMTINEKIRVEDAIILFDRNARKSETIFHNADNKITRLIYYFDKDEVFTIESNKKKISTIYLPKPFSKNNSSAFYLINFGSLVFLTHN
jgi:hypothetical protein